MEVSLGAAGSQELQSHAKMAGGTVLFICVQLASSCAGLEQVEVAAAELQGQGLLLKV